MSARSLVRHRRWSALPWASSALVVTVAVALGHVGCPDPCALAGGCNTTADCPDGEVCRKPRAGEPGCFVVQGTCLVDDGRRAATLCGSVDDCAADECCDPRWNRCVRADRFVATSCDAQTCRDCGAADIRDECSGRNDCPSGLLCNGALETDSGLCSAVCSVDDDCRPGQRCSVGTCTVTFGKPCITAEERGIGSVPQEDRCRGLRCVATNAAGQRVDPYCTDICLFSDPDGELCPDGFVCGDDDVCAAR